MVNGLRRLKLTTRIMALAFFLVSVTAGALLFLLLELNNIHDISQLQQQKVNEQNQWLQQEAELMQAQEITQQLLQQSQQVQKSYSDMLFWYFDGSVTQYYDSLTKAADAASQLEHQLSELMTDVEAAQQIPKLLSRLSEYRSLMNGAINYYTEGKNNLAAATISDAHLVVQDMNEQLLLITQLFQTRLRQANLKVEQVLQLLQSSGEEVAEHSIQNQQRTEQIQRNTLLILLVSTPLTIMVAGIIILSIIRPLKTLQEQLLKISTDSDLSHNIRLEGQDEISTMSEALQKLLTQFRHTLTDMDQMAGQLKTTAQHALMASNATHQKSSEQQQQTHVIAATTTELGASAEDILRTTRQGLTLVQAAAQAASEGQHDVQATARCIGLLAAQFDEMEITVKDLATHSNSIGTVLVVIREIAEQTNLLALNAAIEAARAGEQGRGFAVVADEVRSLAQRTSLSTNEVQALIEQLEKQSALALKALAQNRAQMDSGVTLSQQAAGSLTIIIQEMTSLTEVNHSISTISDEQQQAISAVDAGVQQVQQLALAVEHHAADSKYISQQLDQMAEQLQQQLQGFKH